jgi:hypothetical protein
MLRDRVEGDKDVRGNSEDKLCGRLSSRGKLANASPSVHKCGFN